MADEGAPLLRLAPPRTLTRKKGSPRFRPAPPRIVAEHGVVLGRGVDEVQRHFAEAVNRFPDLVTDVPYVRIEVAPQALITDAELASVGLVSVYRREDAILAAYTRDRDLRTLTRQVGSYVQQEKALGVLAKIESLKPWSQSDRLGRGLKGLTIDPAGEYTVDLLLMPFREEEANPAAARAVERFVIANGGRVVDRSRESHFSALRVRLGGQALDDILEYRDDIALAELPPAAHVMVPEALSLSLDDLPEVAAPNASAPVICVVDSGILEGHPLLEGAMLGAMSRAFPPQLGSPVPSPAASAAGHGTQVAGIALYGDVGASAHAKAFAPEIRLVNARMLDDNNELHPDRMPFLREVVEHVAGVCRILNLSFGLEPHDGSLSMHAAELDALAREFGVLFLVSSGNVDPGVYFAGAAPAGYPAFLLDHAYRVRSPAEALNVLTVGGITSNSDPFRARDTFKAVAPKRAPSPFACSGGIKNVVKPELVEVAGNVAFDSSLRIWNANDGGLRVLTTSPRFATDALLGFVHGTSFSTPRVANLAARLIDRYADATPNLLRALLVQSARLPEGARDWKPAEAMRLCGFGVPDLDRALFCRPARATLFHEGQILPDEVKLFDIPVPLDFAKSSGRKAITVTIAFDPPVSVLHRDRPAGIHLTWGLARGDVAPATLEAAVAQQAELEIGATAKTPAKAKKPPFLKGDLPKAMQARGTVQKNVFSWQRGAYGETYRLAVTAKATRPAYATTAQRFAVVVSLEAEDESVNVFHLVRARLGAGRVRVRVPAA